MKVKEFLVIMFLLNLTASQGEGGGIKTLLDMVLARVGGGYMYDKTRPSVEERSDLR